MGQTRAHHMSHLIIRVLGYVAASRPLLDRRPSVLISQIAVSCTLIHQWDRHLSTFPRTSWIAYLVQIGHLTITEVLGHFHWRVLGWRPLMAPASDLVQSESRLFEVVSTTGLIISRIHHIVDHVALAWRVLCVDELTALVGLRFGRWLLLDWRFRPCLLANRLGGPSFSLLLFLLRGLLLLWPRILLHIPIMQQPRQAHVLVILPSLGHESLNLSLVAWLRLVGLGLTAHRRMDKLAVLVFLGFRFHRGHVFVTALLRHGTLLCFVKMGFQHSGILLVHVKSSGREGPTC